MLGWTLVEKDSEKVERVVPPCRSLKSNSKTRFTHLKKMKYCICIYISHIHT